MFLKDISRLKYFIFFNIKRNIRSVIIPTHHIEKPIAIVKMDGGLASQMWQYSIGKSIMKRSGLKVKFDLGWFKGNAKDINNKQNRNFELNLAFPNLEIEEASAEEIALYKKAYYIYPLFNCVFKEKILYDNNPKYLDGYYRNVKYIDKFDFFNYFTTDINDSNKHLIDLIDKNSPSVAIHIRRGDFINSLHEVTSPSYFNNAIDRIRSLLMPVEPTFFVFSDDQEYAQQIICNQKNLRLFFVDINHNDCGRYDMYLMHQCNHHIISNSGFGWWPAFLKRDSQHITIIPSKWINNRASFFLRYKSEEAFVFPGCIRIDV
ncbi:MAG TPA: alpha-1,2-fucosyltransferase [Synergistales bacterium]|nr:alpha-1,2-fucosyltransferase [Synergistales bacterium]